MQTDMPPASSYEPFKLKEKIGEMMRYGRPLTMQFGRRNNDLAIKMRETMIEMYLLASEIEHKYCRKTTTQELDVKLDFLRFLIRTASDKDYFPRGYAPPLSMHQYEVWSRYTTEIGNLLGGYLKTLK